MSNHMLGKVGKLWINYQEWKLLKEWYKQKNAAFDKFITPTHVERDYSTLNMKEEEDNRKCYCIVDIGDGHNTLACRKRVSGELYKVKEYEMTEEPLEAKFVRWATGFDI